MGVLPLQFKGDKSWKSLNIDGSETLDILGLDDHLQPGQNLTVKATRTDGSSFDFTVIARLDSTVDVEYYKNGGILHTVLRQLS